MKDMNGFYPSKGEVKNEPSCPQPAETPKAQPRSKLEIHGEFVLDWKTLDSIEFREYIVDIIIEASQRGRLSISNGGRLAKEERGPLSRKE